MLIYFYSKRCAFSSFSNRCWCPLAQLWTCTYQMNCFGLMHILCEKACQHETKGLVPRVWAFLVEFYSLWSQDRFRLHMSLFKLLCSYWFKWTDGKYINVKTAWFDNTRPVFICVKQRGIKREYIQVLFHSENGLVVIIFKQVCSAHRSGFQGGPDSTRAHDFSLKQCFTQVSNGPSASAQLRPSSLHVSWNATWIIWSL